jgi:hypothetical protein
VCALVGVLSVVRRRLENGGEAELRQRIISNSTTTLLHLYTHARHTFVNQKPQAAHLGMTLKLLDHFGREGRTHRFYSLLRPSLEALVARLAPPPSGPQPPRPRPEAEVGAAARAFASAVLRLLLREPRMTQAKKVLLLDDVLLPLLQVRRFVPVSVCLCAVGGGWDCSRCVSTEWG